MANWIRYEIYFTMRGGAGQIECQATPPYMDVSAEVGLTGVMAQLAVAQLPQNDLVQTVGVRVIEVDVIDQPVVAPLLVLPPTVSPGSRS